MEITITNNLQCFDVIVVGGGPAGCSAAISAARCGAKTLLIEATGALGGMATMGLVSTFAPFTDKKKLIYRSIPLEVLTRYKQKVNIPQDSWDWINIDAEALKLVYDEMVTEAGASVLFGSTVCHSVVKDGNVKCLMVTNKAGITPYQAKIYIDCTGDGDVAAFSGVPFWKGDNDGTLQPASLCFVIAGVRTEHLPNEISSNPKQGLWADIINDGKYPLICKHFIPAVVGDCIFANAGHLYDLDATDPNAVSKAYVSGRKIAEQYLLALREYLPKAFEKAKIVSTAPIMGVRESRRIQGEYCITVDDYLSRRSFADEIGRNCYWMDCHGKNDAENNQFEESKIDRYEPGESHGLPFRCMIPKNIDNLLVAGRCVSMERMALASIRVMPNCMAFGEAAGIGAALAAKKGCGVRDVDVTQVQKLISK